MQSDLVFEMCGVFALAEAHPGRALHHGRRVLHGQVPGQPHHHAAVCQGLYHLSDTIR